MENNLAILWDNEVRTDREKPAKEDWRNKDLKLYTRLAKKNNIRLFLAHFSQYEEGEIKEAWFWNGEDWVIKTDIEVNLVYDKFKYTEETKELKNSIDQDKDILNHLGLEKVCMDKYKTYKLLSNYVPKTKKATKENASQMLEEDEEIVLKPRYGYGGEGIRKISDPSNVEDVSEKNYIIQELVNTDGIPRYDIEGYHDLRIILVNDQMITSYLRIPKDGFRSNVDQGAEMEYIEIESIPEEVKEITREVDQKLSEYKPRMYSVDFILNEDLEPRIMELNSKPGIYCSQPGTKREEEKPVLEKWFSQIGSYSESKN